MPNIGLPELLIVLAILLLIFGAKALPKLSRSIGQSARELRHGLSGEGEKEEKKKSTSSKNHNTDDGSDSA